MLPSGPEVPALFRPPDGLRLMTPPFCYGAWRGPRIDVPMLAWTLRREGVVERPSVVLSDIPDDWASLEEALSLPWLLGAFAVGCGSLDLWLSPTIEPRVERARVGTLRRSAETSLSRVELLEPDEARALWAVLMEHEAS